MSLRGAPARYASAMPSPVLMLAFVVNGKTLPQPPVQRITAFAATAWILPVISSTATTPCTCRTATWPSGCRLHGQPQCSSCSSSRGASSTNASTASWSASQSLPEMVSWMCSSSVSPSAETVWLRIGYTLDITATSRPGSVSAIAIAARSPAPPPPTSSTSWAATKSPSLTAELLLDQNLSAVVHHHVVHAAVVELLPGAPAAALVAHLLGDQTELVLGLGAHPPLPLPTGRQRRLEGRDRRSHPDLHGRAPGRRSTHFPA